MPDELKDVTVVIASTEFDDDAGRENKYAVTKVFRYDLEKEDTAFIKYLEAYPGIIEGGQMKNKE